MSDFSAVCTINFLDVSILNPVVTRMDDRLSKDTESSEPQHTVMFDVDGTLVQSYDFDEYYYLESVNEVLGIDVSPNWSTFQHVTDSGILRQIVEHAEGISFSHQLEHDVRSTFTRKIQRHLQREPAEQTPGAKDFIDALKTIRNVDIAIATGGWLETAHLKLASAGIDVSGLVVASSNDHYSRTEIMQLASRRLSSAGQAAAGRASVSSVKVSYFGDAEWDKIACAKLGYNFILVGARTEYPQRIEDFSSSERAVRYIGL